MHKNKIITLLVGLSLAAAPEIVQAYQIVTGGNVELTAADAENDIYFDNNYWISIMDGGILNNNSGATLNNNHTTNGYALLGIEYGGILNNNLGAILNNYGAFSNGTGGNLYNAGRLYNYHEILSYSTIYNDVGGNIFNNGKLDQAGTLDNFGGLTNNSAGTLNNIGLLNNRSSLNNDGTLNNRGRLENDASLNNGGTLNNFARLNNHTSLYNDGTLNNNLGATLDNANRLTNNDGATLNNEGILNNDVYLENNGILNNEGTLNNNLGSTLFNFTDLNNAGILSNTGTISGNGTYIQTAGQTINNGSFSQTSIQINGGSLSGTGTINGDVTIGSLASVNPGNSPGIMTINGNFTSSGILVFEVAGLGAGQYDVLNINGNADFTGSSIQFDFLDGFTVSAGDAWDFLLADTITGWDTLSFSFNGLGTGLGANFTNTGGHMSFAAVNTVSSVPEPETYTMLLAGLGLMGFMARRRKNIAA